MLALKSLTGLVVVDEIQRLPDLFPVLRVLVDRPRPAARFLVLGTPRRSCCGRVPKHSPAASPTTNSAASR